MKFNYMTIKQKLDEINQLMQTSYGKGELFFKGRIEHLVREFEMVINYVSSIEESLRYQNEKDFVPLAKLCRDDINRVLNLKGSGFVSDKHLNSIKQNSTNLYWTFIQSIERYKANILNQELSL